MAYYGVFLLYGKYGKHLALNDEVEKHFEAHEQPRLVD